MPASSASRPWMATRIQGLNGCVTVKHVCMTRGRAHSAVEEYTDVLSWVWAAPTRLRIPLVAKENVTWHMLALSLEPQVWGLQRKVY